MGLDMYLLKRNYLPSISDKPENKYSVIVKKGENVFQSIKSKRVIYIIEELICWRSAVSIHQWFVKNVQYGCDDCKEHFVSYIHLENLLRFLKSVRDDHSVHEFYGPDDLKCALETIEPLEAIFNEKIEPFTQFIYRSSW